MDRPSLIVQAWEDMIQKIIANKHAKYNRIPALRKHARLYASKIATICYLTIQRQKRVTMKVVLKHVYTDNKTRKMVSVPKRL